MNSAGYMGVNQPSPSSDLGWYGTGRYRSAGLGQFMFCNQVSIYVVTFHPVILLKVGLNMLFQSVILHFIDKNRKYSISIQRPHSIFFEFCIQNCNIVKKSDDRTE